MELLKDQTFVALVLTLIVIAIAIKVTARHLHTTVPGLLARILFWHARWWMNMAVQYDRFLFYWREYRKAHPIELVSETAFTVPAEQAAQLQRMGRFSWPGKRLEDEPAKS